MKKELKIGIFAVVGILTVYFFCKALSFIFILDEEASVGRGITMIILIFLAWIIPFEWNRGKNQSRM